MTPILEAQNLCYTYGTGTPFEKKAVQNVNFKIQQGEFIGVIGHTGSGKSTMIQMMNGLIRPTSGRVLLAGKDIWEEPKKIRAVRFRVGMVFQYPEDQLFEETVMQDISFGPRNMGLTDAEIEKRARDAAKFVGLQDELLDKSPFELSGGEKRRVAIAGVIAMDPDVLVLDEPTAGLDPAGRDVLLSEIVSYHEERGNTIMLVSHSMEDVARVADRVMVMNSSQMLLFSLVNLCIPLSIFVTHIILGFIANNVYRKHCVKTIQHIQANVSNESEALISYQEKGGINTVLLVMVLICYLIVSNIVNYNSIFLL